MISSFDLSLGQGKLLSTQHLFFLSCDDPLNLPRCIISFLAQDVLHTSTPLSVSEPLVHMGSLTLEYVGSYTYVYITFGHSFLLTCPTADY